MGSTALKGVKLNGSGLAPYFSGNLFRQIAGRTGQLTVAEGIHIVNIICQFADITSVRNLHTLGDSHYHRLPLLLKRSHLFHKIIHVKGNLRQK